MSPSRKNRKPHRPAPGEPEPVSRIERSLDLVSQVERILREAILKGRFAAGRLPTEVELAEQLGVSRETVRRATEVLAREGLLVKYRRRGTFLQGVDMTFPPEAAPPALGYLQADYRLQEETLELVTRDTAGLMLQGALEAAGDAGFELTVRRSRPEKLEESFRLLNHAGRLKGVIFASIGEDKLLRRLAGCGVAGVLLDHDMSRGGFSSVRDDSFGGAQMAVQHLARLGHRRIALAYWQIADLNPWRLRGYREGLRDAGLPRRRQWEFLVELSPQGACQAVDSLLALSPRPTALYCFNNSLARLVMEELPRRGLSVPDDLSVMGGGGEHVPDLTCHQADWYETGRRSAEMLLHSLSQQPRDGAEHHLVPHTLQPGRTAVPPRTK